MPRYARGDIVWVPFPFSAEEGYKSRPAIVMASWPCRGTTDYHLCMISTQTDTDPYLMELNNTDAAFKQKDKRLIIDRFLSAGFTV